MFDRLIAFDADIDRVAAGLAPALPAAATAIGLSWKRFQAHAPVGRGDIAVLI